MRILLAIVLLLAASGCAAATPKPKPPLERRVAIVHDDRQLQQTRHTDPEAYRDKVDRRAFKRGVQVIWVNPPRGKHASVDPRTHMTTPTEPLRYYPTVQK